MYPLAPAIEEALNTNPRLVISPYTITYELILGRFQVGNPWTGADEGCYIASELTLQHSLDPEIFWCVSKDSLRGAFRQMGMVTGYLAGATRTCVETPLTLRDIPTSSEPQGFVYLRIVL